MRSESGKGGTSSPKGHSRSPGYRPGDNWLNCDICGFNILASESKKTWDGLVVCPADWEPRHPQDFVRARQEKIAADIQRPEPDENFIEVDFKDATSTVPPGTFDNDL